MIDILVQDQMEEIDAIEYLEYNTWNTWIGDNTPIYMDQMNHDELIEMINEDLD